MSTLHGDWTGLLSFVSAVLLSTFILLFLPSSSVSLSNFYLTVPMRGCLGKHACMSSPFPVTILNGTCSLRALILFCGDVPAIKSKLNKQTNKQTSIADLFLGKGNMYDVSPQALSLPQFPVAG